MYLARGFAYAHDTLSNQLNKLHLPTDTHFFNLFTFATELLTPKNDKTSQISFVGNRSID